MTARRALAGLVVLAVIGLGIWAVVAANQPDEAVVAAELADDVMAAWGGSDADSVAALYAVDGVHVPPPEWGLETAVGREAVRAHAVTYVNAITDASRTGELVSAGSGPAYVFPVGFLADGKSWIGEIEIQLEGDLASRVEFLSVEVID